MTVRSVAWWKSRGDDFLFRPVDARAAAWMRIAFAIIIPVGFWSQGMGGPVAASASISWWYQNVFLTFGYWGAIVALCGLLGMGWRPRLCAGLLVLIVVPLVFLAPGYPSRQVLFFALLAFSLVRSGVVRFPWRNSGPKILSSAGPGWPIRLIQLQLSVLYGLNALAKSRPGYLAGDNLMDMSLVLPNFLVDMTDGFLRLGPITLPVGVAAVVSALAELFLAVGFWLRPSWRKWVACFGVGFHLLLTFIVDIHLLHVVSVFLYLAFLLPLIPASKRCR